MNELYSHTANINALLARNGVKFGIYKNGEFKEQLFPFDPIPRVITKSDFDEIEKDIIDRDYRDMHRETAPLKQAEDAILLDSSELDIDGVVNRMKEIIKEAIE